jgi:deoxyribodipyrimidine photo-lyase
VVREAIREGDDLTELSAARSTHGVPSVRLRRVNDAKPAKGDFVVYWMIASRRVGDSFALQFAAGEAERRRVPLVVLEAIRCDYRWASDRLHRFALDGMAANSRALGGSGVAYHPYVEPRKGAGRGLLEALSARSCLVVTDEFPCFFLPHMVEAAGRKLDVPLVAVDSNGLVPLRATDRVYPTAYAFRRFLQRVLPEHLEWLPEPDPLRRRRLPAARDLPDEILDTWPAAPLERIQDDDFVSSLPIDHEVPPVAYRGGERSGQNVLRDFIGSTLDRYAEDRNDPDADAASGLSPWLHWGHVSTHGVLRKLIEREGWKPSRLSDRTDGKRSGWWGMSDGAEAFLDEIVTWRELGYNMTAHAREYDTFASLPDWARVTLNDHRADPRPATYTRSQFENAGTHDELWNAAQRQLRREGRIHNYLRMLWGKKILEWSESPEAALDIMIDINNRWSVDGRNPNSFSGIFWCLGRYDRPWPERAVFGRVRSMTSASTRRKHSVSAYLDRFG